MTYHFEIKSGKKGSAAEHGKYIVREGKHRKRGDLVARGYGNMPEWSKDNPATRADSTVKCDTSAALE